MVAIDEERRHLLADVVCTTAIHHVRLGQWHPRRAPQEPAERVGRRRAMHPSHDKIRPDLDFDAGCPCAQPTCRVASRPARDHRTELVVRDHELGHLDHVVVGKALESGVSDVQLQGAIELVGQATLAEFDVAVHAAVSGVGVELDHASILPVDWSVGRSLSTR